MMKRGLLAFLLLAGMGYAQITVNGDTAILIDSREPGPIQKAARDLAADWKAVFGKPVRLVHEIPSAPSTVICIAFSHNLPKSVTRPTGWEVLRLEAVSKPWPGSAVQTAVVLSGSDVRGVIYSIYEFSHRFLKVDPFYWWTDNPPVRQRSVAIPNRFAEQQGSPTFRYRGWFLNDEDLLTAWRPGKADKTGISLETWDRIFEALLRLKGNMIIPTTFIFPYEPQVRAAGERGLAITQHHMEPLGLNVYRWPASVPYNLDRLFAAWRCAVQQYPKDIEVVWTVGLRGRYDRPFWPDMPGAPKTPEERSRLIRQAIEKQIELVRSMRPNPKPEFILNSWMEGSGLLRKGSLQLPAGVARVWADNGRGTLQDGGLIQAGEGVYYHTAVVGGNGNNFTERVPIERIARELGRAAKAGATRYMLLNLSDIRPATMTSRAVMELSWDAKPWIAEGRDQSSEFLTAWSREEFGEAAAPLVEQYYKAYFAAPARYDTAEDATVSDEFMQWCAHDLLVRIIQNDAESPVRFRFLKVRNTAEYGRRVAEICREAEPRWERAAALAEGARVKIPAERQDFFRAHVLTQLKVHLHDTRMLRAIAEAAIPETSREAKLARIDAAVKELNAIFAALREAEYGKWAGFYTLGDWFVDTPLTLQLAEICRTSLSGRALSPAEQKTVERAARMNREDTSYVYIRLKDYQKGQAVQFCESNARP